MAKHIQSGNVTLRIILKEPPKGVVFGVQKGSGSAYETLQKQTSGSDEIRFEISVGVRFPEKDLLPDFAGPEVQGPKGGRFVYVDIGTYAGDKDSCWGRRLKVPLSGISSEMAADGNVLEARVPGTGKDGGPNCASVKLAAFAGGGWRRL